MSIEDFRTLEGGSLIETDLCLVGSGPAGWTIAEELRNSGLRILLLESGGLELEPESSALNETEDMGVPLFNGRDRVLGGTSHSWGGRCIAFDDIDYEARPWVPRSGWPIGPETVAPHLNRASEYLGASPYEPDGSGPAPEGLSKRPAVDPTLLRNLCWEDPEPVHFGRLLRARQNPNLRVLVHATATHLDTDASGRHLKSVQIADPQGKRSTVSARAVVLCAGGVENARILLYSNRILPNGVGNAYDVVGRYFMDHPRDPDLTVRFNTSAADRVRALFGPYKLDGGRHRNSFVHGFALSYEMQRRRGLLNCTAWPFEIISADDPIVAAKRLAAGPTRAIRDVGLVLSQPGVILRALHARLIADQRARPKIDRIGFLIGSEQSPDPDSRIQLSERRDRLGLPLSKINWRIGSQERASQAMLAQVIATEFQRLGLPQVHLAEWVTSNRHEDAVLVDGCHPIGTTRMSSDPRYGVVDAECQVHGVEGLYVAGSSIFPTGGHANPTLMIVAFAVRLAHHLNERLSTKLKSPSLSEPSHAAS